MIEKLTPSIGVIGSGRVANAIGLLLHAKSLTIAFVHSRNTESGNKLASKLNCPFIESIKDTIADIIIICINDDEVQSTIEQFSKDQKVLYTAGSVDIKMLQHEKCGVFYPLQTFTDHTQKMDNQFPMLIEANDKELFLDMIHLCEKSGLRYEKCNSEKRKEYHLVAVMLNNFVNHLVYLSQQEAKERGLNWSILQPLLEKTCDSMLQFQAKDNQTGPARRGDQSILEKHESMLDEKNKKIYQLLSKSIISTYKNEL